MLSPADIARMTIFFSAVDDSRLVDTVAKLKEFKPQRITLSYDSIWYVHIIPGREKSIKKIRMKVPDMNEEQYKAFFG